MEFKRRISTQNRNLPSFSSSITMGEELGEDEALMMLDAKHLLDLLPNRLLLGG
jgi:hypothetical protein